MAALATAGLAPAGPAHGATVRLEPLRQAALLDGGTATARVDVPRGTRWELRLRPLGRPAATPDARRTGAGPRARVALRLTAAAAGRVSACRRSRLVAELRVRGRVAGRRAVRRLRLDPLRCAGEGRPRGAPGYRAGVGVRSIAPRAQDGTVFLGGYGIGGGSPFAAGRRADGTLADGIEVRAVAIEADGRAVLLADAEVQGWFAAVQEGPYGLTDLRREVAARSGGLLDPQRVVVQSNHSHSAPDLLGAWGGVSLSYRRLVYDRTVEAALEALARLQPVTVAYGTADAEPLISNQFEGDPQNPDADDEIRVLEARAARDGRTVVTVVNHSAHATVLGPSNLRASGDWTTSANLELERRTGAPAVTLMGTLGRTQPRDRGCPDAKAGEERDLCAVRGYAAKVVDRVADARAAAGPVGVRPIVDGRSFLVQDLSTNPPVLGLNYVGAPLGAQLSRSITPPWLTGTYVGTTTATLRIGDVLLSAVPGEAYPQIAELVRTLTRGAKGWMTMGLAGDQLGYLIAPRAAYPEPLRRTLFNERGDQISPIDNDNYLFNVSLTVGERVTCSLLRGAGELLERGTAPRDAYDRCASYDDDLLRAPGADIGG
ncbi:hypothetical protein C7Y72_12800 [Paraconexibacter algicola]|uniref:Neutral/alkaline non-lysosomal ceramidase N-terminal domain-containing protein n=1 Tax=Paraconexibacter algicola TaxID=2133960 RepID=A0A2T4UMK6_9ACTN|nr:hypothetical protein C7Y72_12800 [Paraconexibacter algicola]